VRNSSVTALGRLTELEADRQPRAKRKR